MIIRFGKLCLLQVGAFPYARSVYHLEEIDSLGPHCKNTRIGRQDSVILRPLRCRAYFEVVCETVFHVENLLNY